MIEISMTEPNAPLEIKVGGTLKKEDYEKFSSLVEQIIRMKGRLRILLLMDDFHGWTVSALWEDIKFDLKHFNDIERLAFVGDSKWEKGMALFCKPFTSAKIRYFDLAQQAEARAWINE